MFVQGNFTMSKPLINVQYLNRNMQKNDTKLADQDQREKRDIVTISPQGKINQMMESLMKQKQNIMDQKKELIGNTLDRGGSMKSIEEQLEAYDEQLEMLDQQISSMIEEQVKSQLEKTEKQKQEEPQSEEELEVAKVKDMLSLSGDFKDVKAQAATQEKLEGQVRVSKMEIKTDGARMGSASDHKKEQVADLEKSINNLTASIGETINQVNDQVKDAVESGAQVENNNQDVQNQETAESEGNEAEKSIDKPTEQAATE